MIWRLLSCGTVKERITLTYDYLDIYYFKPEKYGFFGARRWKPIIKRLGRTCRKIPEKLSKHLSKLIVRNKRNGAWIRDIPGCEEHTYNDIARNDYTRSHIPGLTSSDQPCVILGDVSEDNLVFKSGDLPEEMGGPTEQVLYAF